MRRLVTALFATLCLLTVAPGALAGPGVRHRPAATTGPLLDQMGSDGMQAASSYARASDGLNAETADDVFVPGGHAWQVTEIDVRGDVKDGTPNPNSFDVHVYTSSGGQPATLVAERLAQPYGGSNESFTISLSTPIRLSAGYYWLSVQGEVSAGGYWFWEGRNVDNGSASEFRNPGDELGTGCTSWNSYSSCIGTDWDDQMFRLIGTSTSSILYDQYQGGDGSAVVSFTDGSSHDSAAADDFVIPSTRIWTVKEIDVQAQALSTLSGYDVHIYRDEATYPGPVVVAQLGLPYQGHPGDEVIKLDPPVQLGPGTYWVSVQGIVSTGSRWYWGATDVTIHSPAVWENPGDGYGTGCTSWSRTISCGLNGQLFRLDGKTQALVRRPDGLLKTAAQSTYLGNDVYSSTGAGQSVTAPMHQGATRTFDVQIQNDGNWPEGFVVDGPGGTSILKVAYLQGPTGTTDVTAKVEAGTYRTGVVAPGQRRVIRLKVTATQTAPIGAVDSWLLRIRAADDLSIQDAVEAVGKVLS